MFELSKSYMTPLVESGLLHARIAGLPRSSGTLPAQRTTISELERTRRIRLFYYNKALRWPQKVLAQRDFRPVL